jgi:hypothetical protein
VQFFFLSSSHFCTIFFCTHVLWHHLGSFCFTSWIKWLPFAFLKRLWTKPIFQAFIWLFQVIILTHVAFIYKWPFLGWFLNTFEIVFTLNLNILKKHYPKGKRKKNKLRHLSGCRWHSSTPWCDESTSKCQTTPICKWIPMVISTLFFHVKSHISRGNSPFSHDQTFKWISPHYCGGNVVLILKSCFMPSILWCLCNTFFPTPIWNYNQGGMWRCNHGIRSPWTFTMARLFFN